MEIKGATGFDTVKYDPTEMGEYIAENLMGVSLMKKASRQEKALFIKEKYPDVMDFFKGYDLQPTLMNLRLNLEGIKAHKAGQLVPEVSYTGSDTATSQSSQRKQEAKYVISLLVLIGVLIYIIK